MSNKPIYLSIASELKKQLRLGQLVGKIPGERELAKRFKCSYMTARKSVDQLVIEGLLERRGQKGTFVSNQSSKKRNQLLGFFLDKKIKHGIASSYYSLVLNKLIDQAGNKGCEVVVFNNSDMVSFERTLRRVDGVIAACRDDNDRLIIEIAKSKSLVTLDNPCSNDSIPSVVLKNFESTSQATQHLINLGHKKIAYIRGLNNSQVGRERFDGFQHTMSKNNLSLPESYIIQGDYSLGAGENAAKNLVSLKTPPTAIVCANDEMALGAIKYIKRLGMRCPDHFSIVGFDNIDAASQSSPSLTTVSVPIERMATHALNLLNKLITQGGSTEAHVTLSCEMIERETTSTPRKRLPKLSIAS